VEVRWPQKERRYSRSRKAEARYEPRLNNLGKTRRDVTPGKVALWRNPSCATLAYQWRLLKFHTEDAASCDT